MKIYRLSLFFLVLLLFSCSGPQGSPEEETALKEAMGKNSLAALDAFLNEYPETKHKEAVADRRETILYSLAMNEKTEYHLNKYLKEFPQGKRKNEVQAELDKLENTPLSIDDVYDKTFVGTIHYMDEMPVHKEILTAKFYNPSDNGNELNCNAIVQLGLELKKDLKVIIEKSNLSIKFVENESDEFLLEIPEGRIYKINNHIIVESTSANSNKYWILK